MPRGSIQQGSKEHCSLHPGSPSATRRRAAQQGQISPFCQLLYPSGMGRGKRTKMGFHPTGYRQGAADPACITPIPSITLRGWHFCVLRNGSSLQPLTSGYEHLRCHLHPTLNAVHTTPSHCPHGAPSLKFYGVIAYSGIGSSAGAEKGLFPPSSCH